LNDIAKEKKQEQKDKDKPAKERNTRWQGTGERNCTIEDGILSPLFTNAIFNQESHGTGLKGRIASGDEVLN
jgi:hypothetical protein